MMPATLIDALAILTLGLGGIMTVAWLAQHRTRNGGWIDVGWTFGLGLAGVAGALAPLGTEDGLTWRQLAVAILVALWSLRLGLHIVQRTRRTPDDPRYARLRHEWGPRASLYLLGLALGQALASLPLLLAIVVAAHNPDPQFGIQAGVAVGLVVVAVMGEGLADHQLRAFKADPAHAHRICDRGLWAWSRHPNYFFEWLVWLAYPLFAINLDGGYPMGWLALLAPAVMYGLLVHVSGIPPLEAHLRETRGSTFSAYQRRTSAFFPWPPRNRMQQQTP